MLLKRLSKKKKKLCLSLRLSTVFSFAESLANRTTSWMRLVRVVAWLRRPLLLRENRSIDLQPSELNDAELTLFWLAQEMFRHPDQRRLRQRLNMVPSEDERVELLRIDGRLSKCPWRESTMNPIPLPGSNLIVKLYVTQIYQILGYQGYHVVLSYLHEQGIYITQGRKLLKSIFFNCMKCRLFRRRLLTQQMGQLPKFRFTTHFSPFSSIVLDYFGPVKVKKTRNVIIDASIILITCTTTRVVHLEITETQSTNDFLLAWRRFCLQELCTSYPCLP